MSILLACDIIRANIRTRSSRYDVEEEWFEDGSLKSRAEFVNGFPHGESESWYKSGRRKSSRVYHHGQLIKSVKWDDIDLKITSSL